MWQEIMVVIVFYLYNKIKGKCKTKRKISKPIPKLSYCCDIG